MGGTLGSSLHDGVTCDSKYWKGSLFAPTLYWNPQNLISGFFPPSQENKQTIVWANSNTKHFLLMCAQQRPEPCVAALCTVRCVPAVFCSAAEKSTCHFFFFWEEAPEFHLYFIISDVIKERNLWHVLGSRTIELSIAWTQIHLCLFSFQRNVYSRYSPISLILLIYIVYISFVLFYIYYI